MNESLIMNVPEVVFTFDIGTLGNTQNLSISSLTIETVGNPFFMIESMLFLIFVILFTWFMIWLFIRRVHKR